RPAAHRPGHQDPRAGPLLWHRGLRVRRRRTGSLTGAVGHVPLLSRGLRPMSTVVEFHFDPMCPFAYQTSLWIRDVRDELGITVNWRFFSLEEINRSEDQKHPWEREWSYGWSLMRIGVLLRRTDMSLLDRWYAAIGRELHTLGGKPHDPVVARRLLGDI